MAARRRSLGKRPSCSCSEADCWFGVVGDGSGFPTSSGVVSDSGPSWSRARTRNRLLVGTAGIVFVLWVFGRTEDLSALVGKVDVCYFGNGADICSEEVVQVR